MFQYCACNLFALQIKFLVCYSSTQSYIKYLFVCFYLSLEFHTLIWCRVNGVQMLESEDEGTEYVAPDPFVVSRFLLEGLSLGQHELTDQSE